MSGAASARAAVEALLGVPTRAARPLGGTASAVETDDGTVVAKRGTGPGAASAEAASLRWLAEPAVVPVPRVLAADDDWPVTEPRERRGWLVTELVEPGRPDPAAADALGRGLAALHAAGAPAFGAAPPGGRADAWIGAARMANVTGESWPEWYAEHRVRPYLRAAADAGAVDRSGVAAVEAVCHRVAELAGPPEPPARLHGDLWSGNVLWSADGRAWLIDPAAHGGHRETDLAMLALFGCPHLDRVLAAYDEAAPLAAGWRGRVGLHQLFPLLVHAVLFGGGYGASAAAAARAALSV